MMSLTSDTIRFGHISDMERVLQVEDDPRLANMVCPETDMLLWPMVRTPFLRLILSDLLYETPIPTGRGAGRIDQIQGLVQAELHNKFKGKMRGQITIRASAIGSNTKEGLLFNRLSDYFVDQDPQGTVVLEDLGGRVMPQNRYNSRVLYHDPILVRATIAARLNAKQHYQTATDLVDLLETRAKCELGWTLSAANRDWYLALVTRYIARAPRLLSGYKALLQKLGTKLLIAEEACYGNSMVCLIAAARELGIPSAEYQHGMVSRGHDAYALAPTLAASPAYRKMLPDYFLGYGRWWNAQLKVPVLPVVIGNPHGDAMRANIHHGTGIKTDVLILGDGIESDTYINFAQKLASQLPKQQVIFRPHPQERSYFSSKYRTGQMGSVKIDQNPDIYSSLNAAHAVVSEMSTGLFEAVGLADRVLMWATPKANFYLPSHPFETFSDVEALVKALSVPCTRPLEWTVDDIWAPNWQENYRSFIQEVIR